MIEDEIAEDVSWFIFQLYAVLLYVCRFIHRSWDSRHLHLVDQH